MGKRRRRRSNLGANLVARRASMPRFENKQKRKHNEWQIVREQSIGLQQSTSEQRAARRLHTHTHTHNTDGSRLGGVVWQLTHVPPIPPFCQTWVQDSKPLRCGPVSWSDGGFDCQLHRKRCRRNSTSAAGIYVLEAKSAAAPFERRHPYTAPHFSRRNRGALRTWVCVTSQEASLFSPIFSCLKTRLLAIAAVDMNISTDCHRRKQGWGPGGLWPPKF